MSTEQPPSLVLHTSRENATQTPPLGATTSRTTRRRYCSPRRSRHPLRRATHSWNQDQSINLQTAHFAVVHSLPILNGTTLSKTHGLRGTVSWPRCETPCRDLWHLSEPPQLTLAKFNGRESPGTDLISRSQMKRFWHQRIWDGRRFLFFPSPCPLQLQEHGSLSAESLMPVLRVFVFLCSTSSHLSSGNCAKA